MSTSGLCPVSRQIRPAGPQGVNLDADTCPLQQGYVGDAQRTRRCDLASSRSATFMKAIVSNSSRRSGNVPAQGRLFVERNGVTVRLLQRLHNLFDRVLAAQNADRACWPPTFACRCRGARADAASRSYRMVPRRPPFRSWSRSFSVRLLRYGQPSRVPRIARSCPTPSVCTSTTRLPRWASGSARSLPSPPTTSAVRVDFTVNDGRSFPATSRPSSGRLRSSPTGRWNSSGTMIAGPS